MDFDLVVRGGDVVDGSGRAAFRADVGVKDGLIAAIATDLACAAGTVTVDAGGCIVTPGFVDVHTHYDGQATWDEVLEPSSNHGVTTVVAGNCGVGFAPVRPGSEEQLIRLMEGVEDIPGTALHEGMTWGWETFGEYVDTLSRRRFAVDIGVQLPHGALRTYVMGDRGVRNEKATADDVAEMSRLAAEAMGAGAFGFSTSRTMGHLSKDGQPVPGTFADDDELFAIARAVRDGGGRIFEVAMAGITPADDPSVIGGEMDWIGRMAMDTGLTVCFLALQQHNAPDRWRDEMETARQWRDKGAAVVPLIAGRPFGVLIGLDARHPFRDRPTYESLAGLPLAERAATMRQPQIRGRILAETPAPDPAKPDAMQAAMSVILPMCYVLDGVPDYEPTADRSLGALAAARDATVDELAYDALTAGDGSAMLLWPLFNYAGGDHGVLHEQLLDPAAVLGLADGGAHCGAICDASMPTYLLTHWVRDRTRGPRLELADAVRRLSAQPAELYGFADRGRIEIGLRADLNVIDPDGLRLHTPRAAHDLPAGGTRLLQDADGYRATIVHGEITRRDGADTGARPGRLVRHTR